MSFKSFEELKCWQEGRKLLKFISSLSKKLPGNEFDLKDNMLRAARSVTGNIAEGFGRFHHQEKIQFCRQSRGSATEVLDDLITCSDEGYITDSELEQGRKLINSTCALINGYITYLANAKEVSKDKPTDN
jgi:four helix bundle protein